MIPSYILASGLILPSIIKSGFCYMTRIQVVYKTVNGFQYEMGRRRSTAKPQKKRRTVEGRCPKCTTIVRFNVGGQVGDEIYECTGCMSKFHIDEL